MTETELNEAKLQIERDKLTIEERRLDLQRLQVRWTAMAVFVPLVVAMGTITISVITLGKQAQTAADIQQRQAADQFEMTAAQLVIANNDPEIASSKAAALQKLFPNRFGSDWLERFDQKTFCLPVLEDRMAFARLALEYPKDRQRLATLWQQIFCEQESAPFTAWLSGAPR